MGKDTQAHGPDIALLIFGDHQQQQHNIPQVKLASVVSRAETSSGSDWRVINYISINKKNENFSKLRSGYRLTITASPSQTFCAPSPRRS
ncbi:hypothetical protein AVEN_80698-1 [Araneus ventricosus]|uniref:Uncharacterized protein n=1 Tax=Araneus ventricosus TaxID=182803 RepID=A0A4Y2PVJ5_ARAVE|nr:hypothetical protein AVEN_80698-1 [Araneus ventricosus]